MYVVSRPLPFSTLTLSLVKLDHLRRRSDVKSIVCFAALKVKCNEKCKSGRGWTVMLLLVRLATLWSGSNIAVCFLFSLQSAHWPAPGETWIVAANDIDQKKSWIEFQSRSRNILIVAHFPCHRWNRPPSWRPILAKMHQSGLFGHHSFQANHFQF